MAKLVDFNLALHVDTSLAANTNYAIFSSKFYQVTWGWGWGKLLNVVLRGTGSK